MQEAPHSPVFDASPDPDAEAASKAPDSAAASAPAAEPRARRAARPKSFADGKSMFLWVVLNTISSQQLL
jgi:hypothetical protein